MDEREELLQQLKATRRLVADLTAHLPFNDKMSQFIDWLDQAIERMEHRE